MRSIVSRVLVVAVVATGLLVTTPAAWAHTEICSGVGSMNTPVLFHPVVGPPGSGPFSGSMPPNSLGLCTPTFGGLFFAGSMSGSCELASGSGTANGHSFSFLWVGTTMTFSGDVQGTLQVYPDILGTPPQSCISGATRFLFVGSLAMGVTPTGGLPGPSADCTTGTIINNTSPVALTLRVHQAGPSTLWVCVRADMYGGKLVIDTTGGTPALPTTDTNAAACGIPGTVDGEIGGPSDPHYTPYYLDVYTDSSQVWLCVDVDGVALRVIVPTAGPGLPSVTFQADPGTPDPI